MKTFDIYLNDRITECDIIVQNLPFREAITVENRVVLEECVKSCLLLKLIAVASGSELAAHIDDTLLTCCERLGIDMDVDAQANFVAHSFVEPTLSTMHLMTSKVNTLVHDLVEAHSGFEIAVSPILPDLKQFLEEDDSILEIGTFVDDTLKHGYESARAPVEIDAEALAMSTLYAVPSENAVQICASLAGIVMGRPRKLSEMDGHPLSYFDNMTLEDVDYIVTT